MIDQEHRRPGIGLILTRLRRENPRAPQEQLLAQAKNAYSSKTRVVKRNGVMVEEPNPEYMGGRS